MTIRATDFLSEEDYEAALAERWATPDEAMAEYAFAVGDQALERAWILTDFDVWVKNPHYAGPPVPHPEADDY